MTRVPERGDIVWITMNSSVEHEQLGRRPALVLSPGFYNGKVGLALLCPIASQVKGYPFEVALPDGLPVEGVVLSDQAKSLDWKSREAELVCKVPSASVTEVLQKLGRLVAP
ncbi:MAG: type II toxin-antitoxin system PemK/MazF family toxin [Actinomycetia bacterium]|nr:type II toxin-antitoxin system PemK/MazF family toxin [Actinomycetes bacterium]